jgi:TP901 family phage tail tape measure protein
MPGKFSIEAIFSGKNHLSRMLQGLEGRLAKFSRSANAAFGQVTGASRRFAQGVNNVSDRVNERLTPSIKSMGVAAAAAGAVATAGLVDVIGTGAEFENTMIRAAAKFSPAIRKGTAEFEALRIATETVGAKTEFNAQQAAGALKELASAGFGSKQAIAALAGVVDLATVAELDLNSASEIATKSLGAFGLKTENATQLGLNLSRVNDVLARTADATSASIGGLFETIKEGAPVAMTAGGSLETFMALAGQLSESGIEASVAGTTLKNFFLSLAAPTAEASAVLDRFGIKTKDASGNVADAISVLGQLEKATSKLGSADKSAALEGIFGKIPIAGVASLVGSGSFEKLQKLRTELEKAGGSTALQAGVVRDSTKSDIDGLTSAWDGLKIAIFGVIGAPVRDALQGMTKGLGGGTDGILGLFEEAIPYVKAFVGALGDGFREAWPAIKGALGILFDGFGSKATWLSSVKDFASLLGKITAGAVGLAVVLGGMFAAGVQLATGAVNLLLGAWNGMIAGIGNAILWFEDVGARLGAMWDAFVASASGAAKGLIDGLVNGIKSGAKWVVDAIENLGTGAMDALKSLLGISSPSKVFAGYGGNVVDGFVKGLQPLSGTLRDAMPELPTLPAMAQAMPFAAHESDPLAQLDRIRMMPTASRWLGGEAEDETPNARRGASSSPQVVPTVHTESRVEDLLEELIKVTRGKDLEVSVSASGAKVSATKSKPSGGKVTVSASGSFK